MDRACEIYPLLARDFIPFTVYDRYKLSPGETFSGPAIVEERESTVIVGEEAEVRVDEFGSLWIEMIRMVLAAPRKNTAVGLMN